MSEQDDFLKTSKVLHLATIDSNHSPHIVPVWYIYTAKKFYIGTNSKTKKVKNLQNNNHTSFCVDKGINAPNIYGVMGQGKANVILDKIKVKKIATDILLRYFSSIKNPSAQELLSDTDCVIEIIPQKISTWKY
jgi:nitroimidazol reductase NimA-like FMN-containing flavoprotein (pyridoxamine 5'-phosphate oxidase superfamily)